MAVLFAPVAFAKAPESEFVPGPQKIATAAIDLVKTKS
jgi:hypothetical protein